MQHKRALEHRMHDHAIVSAPRILHTMIMLSRAFTTRRAVGNTLLLARPALISVLWRLLNRDLCKTWGGEIRKASSSSWNS